ncbi:hypothetical protein IWX48DRAFT_597073 [Phyllosticta citricarpa]
MTIIAEREAAVDNGLPFTFACRSSTLSVHSSLEAVGLMAVAAARLEELVIPVNPVSGYHHDHCFVPEGREDEALAALHKLALQAHEGKAALRSRPSRSLALRLAAWRAEASMNVSGRFMPLLQEPSVGDPRLLKEAVSLLPLFSCRLSQPLFLATLPL